MRFSVLDQAPARAGGGAAEAVRAAVRLAETADELGFHRFWVAEHHAIGSVSISAPEVVLAMLADRTEGIRVGSGGMLLPNHRPIHVAEQFRVLEALHPGRIDLGIGRSEGALDEAIVRAFARPDDNAHGSGFEAQLDQLLAFGGVRPLPADDPLASAVASPADVPLPPVFLLGSSEQSAETAARKGLGYGFAAHTNPDGAAPALLRYRERFEPTAAREKPHAILAVKVMTGESDQHAAALAAPSHLSMVWARLGGHEPLPSVEEALAHRWTEEERAAEATFIDTRADVTGGPDAVRARIADLAEATQADEIIVITNTSDPDERLAAHRRFAAAVGLEPRRRAAPDATAR
ncbi:MAG: MsnO8 family LLM class oxidoreductase [Solirubrobacteraceae bacterium]|nr:MsnO8 family LLM class oxidoreductase [Patulibacter sp.]